ncbi:DMT family transporter [Alphaproteobacteria bacterium]|jgi:drug/metabolite transporter (DMT)-like permease|nr:DMT family transporter [Alphaproteobacteria bacterium]NCF49504.1 EamA family transporter [Bacteroidota bacterium]
MLVAMLMFTTMGICIRLASQEVHVLEIVFFRNFLALFIMAPVLIRMGRSSIKMNRPKLYFGRAAINFIGMITGFTAVTLIPLAEMTALTFTGPIFVTIGAALFLGENIRMRRIAAIGFGLVGALIILRPGFVEISTGAMLALCSSLTIAGASLFVKKMTETESSSSIVFWMVLFQTPLAFIPVIFVWEMPSAETWVYLWGVAIAGTMAHVLFTRACSMVEITSLQPFEFTKLPFAVVLAWFVFGELPDIWIWIGGIIIFASTAYITRREAIARRLERPPGSGSSAASL